MALPYRRRALLRARRLPYRPQPAGGPGHHHPRPFGPRAARPRPRCWRRPRRWRSCGCGSAPAPASAQQPLGYGEPLRIGDVTRDAGAGRAHARQRAGGDRAQGRARGGLRRLQAPRRPDLRAVRAVRCDLFVTEATFALPVFRHEPDAREIGRLLASLADFSRAHASGRRLRPRQEPAADRAAARGRLRQAIWLHGALVGDVRALSAASASSSGDLRPVAEDGTRKSGRRDRAGAAVGARGPLVAAPRRSGHGVRLGLDAGARRGPASAAWNCRW